MNRQRVLASITLATAAGLMLTACSVDMLIWGAEGARVIQITEEVIQDAAAGEPTPRACPDAAADFGVREQWIGLSAGEPERLQGDFWEDQQALGATWAINLEGRTDALTQEAETPSDVFYSEVDDELCIVDIEWGTVIF